MTTINNLRKHDSREFKVGDWIIDSLVGNKVIRYHEGYAYLDEHYVKAFLKHATPSEIKAGHRIDDTTDHVTDIRNHVSPRTIVWDLASGEDWTAEVKG